jgi:RNA polymerase sigma factor (sigma-70 family)
MPETDRDNLAEFVAGGSAEAFERLARRHADGVYGVCLRKTGNAADAEDAAQAVFLALARKAGSVRADKLASWLHGAARRASSMLVRSRSARARHEEGAAAMVRSTKEEQDAVWRDTMPVLDAELGRLSPKLREAVVRHYLGGRSHTEIAGDIGIPAGTVASRVNAGIEKLRARLQRRGVSLSAALLAGLLVTEAKVSAPAALTAVLSQLAGGSAAAGTGTTLAAVESLARGVTSMLFWTKVKIAAAVLLASSAVAGGGGIALHRLSAAEPAAGSTNRGYVLPKDIQDAVARRRGKTVLSKLADSMKPGAWADLKTKAPPKLWEVGPAGPKPWLKIHGWTDDGAWDSRTGQFLYMGFRLALKFIAYSEEKNEWRTVPERFKWPLKSSFGHIYSDNAHDSARSIYYHHVSGSNLVYAYDLAGKKWTQLPPGPFRGKMATSLEYFPELGGVIRHGEKKVHFYDERKKSWSMLGKTQTSGYHSLARYNPLRKEVLLAGGGNAIVEKIDAKGKITRLDDCPSKLSVRFDKLTIDPVSGRYLIFASGGKKLYELDSEKNEYRLVAEGKDEPVVHSWAIGAPIPEYGVVMFAATQITKGVKLYKHKVSTAKPLETGKAKAK